MIDRGSTVLDLQVEVFKAVAEPLLDEVFKGYSCTLFAYGQTGTGKTFTMEGERTHNASYTWETVGSHGRKIVSKFCIPQDPLAGVVPRSMSMLFDKLKQNDLESMIRVSFLEIYNEECYDLLSSPEDTTKLKYAWTRNAEFNV